MSWLLYPCKFSNNPELSEDEAEDRLQEAIQEKFAVFGEVCLNLLNYSMIDIMEKKLFNCFCSL